MNEQEMPTYFLFAEVLRENGKLRLYNMTHSNEYSILEEEVKFVWVDANEIE